MQIWKAVASAATVLCLSAAQEAHLALRGIQLVTPAFHDQWVIAKCWPARCKWDISHFILHLHEIVPLQGNAEGCRGAILSPFVHSATESYRETHAAIKQLDLYSYIIGAATSPPPNLSSITAASLTLSAASRRPSVATARSPPASSRIAAARSPPHATAAPSRPLVRANVSFGRSLVS